MLISGFFFFFVACIVYMHADMSISKSSATYLAKMQWDEVSGVVCLFSCKLQIRKVSLICVAHNCFRC